MKKKCIFLIILFTLTLSFFACTKGTEYNGEYNNSSVSGEDVTGNTTDIEIATDDITSTFTLVDSSGNSITGVDNVYTIITGGTYVAKGKLEEGEIIVNAPNCDVEIDLEGVSISNSSVSPILVLDSEDFTIKVKKDTLNYLYDNRTTDYSESDDDNIGKGCIYVNSGDLKINGKGTLTVISLYNSGIHGKDNVKIKNVTLLIKAMNNGIKGNDKVTIEENPTIGIVCGNNGIRTSKSDIGNGGSQHGYIYITGGTITINSYGDGIDAAYAVVFDTSTDSDGVTYTPVVDIYTNIYSSYTLSSNSNTKYRGFGGPGGNGGGGFNGGGFGGGTSAEKADDSAKAIKAVESITINAGKIFMYTYDDGIHTNKDKLDTNAYGNALVSINGGSITIKASDDGIHSDGTLDINGGTIYISESHEGIEANIINMKNGEVTLFSNDDGVNASTSINVSGGRLDVTVSPNGDTDGIDSNGTITISGGLVITRGPNSEMASPIDAERSIKVTGGVLIVVGYNASISYSGVTKSSSSSGLSTGDHVVTIGENDISYTNTYTYSGSVTVYGSSSAKVS